MKIDPAKAKGIEFPSNKEVERVDGSKFKDELDKVMNVNKAFPVEGIKETKGVDKIYPKEVDKLERLFVTLEMYKNWLDNPDIKYGQIEGMLENIDEQKTELVGGLNDPKLDSELKGIIKDTVSLVMDVKEDFYALKH